jgi:hypothetical protein
MAARVRSSQAVVTLLAFGWLLALAVLPLALWHRALGDVLGSFHWNVRYLVSELSPWFLLVAGLAFLIPVAVSAGRDPESQLYPRARRAYIAWGTVLYLMGFVLAVQMVEVWSYTR